MNKYYYLGVAQTVVLGQRNIHLRPGTIYELIEDEARTVPDLRLISGGGRKESVAKEGAPSVQPISTHLEEVEEPVGDPWDLGATERTAELAQEEEAPRPIRRKKRRK